MEGERRHLKIIISTSRLSCITDNQNITLLKICGIICQQGKIIELLSNFWAKNCFVDNRESFFIVLCFKFICIYKIWRGFSDGNQHFMMKHESRRCQDQC